jgi:hypothetical protein
MEVALNRGGRTMKRITILVLASLLVSGCFAHTLGVTAGRVVAAPVESTLDFTFGFFEGFFGGEPQEQDKDNSYSPSNSDKSSSDSGEKKIKRDRFGNITFQEGENNGIQ